MNDRASRASFKTVKTIKCVATELSGDKWVSYDTAHRGRLPACADSIVFSRKCCVDLTTPIIINKGKMFRGSIYVVLHSSSGLGQFILFLGPSVSPDVE